MRDDPLGELPATTSRFDYIRLQGGLDLLTPSLQLKPGFLRDAQNVECSITGGYSTIRGYERFDGRTAPSSATYLTFTLNVTGSLAAGDVMTGATSGATATVIYRNGALVAYTKSTGSFTVGETINVAATPRATVTALGGSETALDFDVRMKALAADVYRALIAAVPGSGPVRGVFYFNGTTYALRNNPGATALGLYKSSASGWVNVTLLFELAFTAGSVAPVEGAAVTQGGVSATVRRVCLQSGSWGSSTAAGRLVITAPTGGNFAAGALTTGGTLTVSGVQTQITLAPGGWVETDVGTVDNTPRVYGVDGVNRGWEFDGTTLVPIATGNSPDVPKRVMVHKRHLFFAFGTGSLQHSGIGTPHNWTATAGAAEYKLDDAITVMQRLPGDQTTGAAAICTDRATQILYGSSAANFQLANFEDSAGAKPYTGQRLGQLYVLDDAGIASLAATQAFGNFSTASLTLNIRPWVQTRRNKATGSLVNREKSQYRVFFSDGYGLYVTIANGKLIGKAPVVFPNAVRVCCDAQAADGTEVSYFGSDNGFVYTLDSGTSFDGAAIDAFFVLPYANQGNSRVRKRYRSASFEVQGDSYATFGVTFDLGYGADGIPQGSNELSLAAAYWDDFVWDQFSWDGRSLAPSDVAIAGTAENIAMRVAVSSALYQPITFNSIVLRYSPRRILR